MKKLLLFFVFVFCLGMVSAETIPLDNVNPESLATWDLYNSGYNPAPTYQEIISPYDASTALKISVVGVTTSYCSNQYMSKVYDLGSTYNTDNTELNAYIEFEMADSSNWNNYYNFPYVYVVLLDSNDNIVGYQVWYGRDVIGGLYQTYAAQDLTHYTELSSDKGYFTMDLSEMGPNIEFKKVEFSLHSYACYGTNSIVLDELSLVHNGGSKPVDPVDEVPEFGVIAGFVALIGALGVFAFTRKH